VDDSHRVPETRPVLLPHEQGIKIYRVTKKDKTIKGKLFEKKVYFSVEEQRNCLVEAMWFYYEYIRMMTRATTSPFYIASFKITCPPPWGLAGTGLS
jgi:hypothetical protein